MLAGDALPTAVLESILQGAELAGRLVGVVNLTPYESHLESVVVHWQVHHGQDAPSLRSFSISPEACEDLFSERVLANQLLQDHLERSYKVTTATQRIFKVI